ncbi:MAG: LysM peptidoglycan-binding domain-containing protein [Candidatus Aureabacteria bacterium]|nr:LysM peptidoglycan-binding domain-containing protein [Candidatus Auribacterota bacterium]
MNFKNLLGYSLVGTVSIICVWGLIGGCKSDSGVSLIDKDSRPISIEVAEAEFFKDDGAIRIADDDIVSLKDDSIEVIGQEDYDMVKKCAAPAKNGKVIHIVERGDSLSKISKKYGVSILDISNANGLQKDSVILIGQKLVIPSLPDLGSGAVAGESGQSPENKLVALNGLSGSAGVHVVQKGETLWKISSENKISIEKLMQANNITDASRLMVGTKIIIPVK